MKFCHCQPPPQLPSGALNVDTLNNLLIFVDPIHAIVQTLISIGLIFIIITSSRIQWIGDKYSEKSLRQQNNLLILWFFIFSLFFTTFRADCWELCKRTSFITFWWSILLFVRNIQWNSWKEKKWLWFSHNFHFIWYSSVTTAASFCIRVYLSCVHSSNWKFRIPKFDSHETWWWWREHRVTCSDCRCELRDSISE